MATRRSARLSATDLDAKKFGYVNSHLEWWSSHASYEVTSAFDKEATKVLRVSSFGVHCSLSSALSYHCSLRPLVVHVGTWGASPCLW